MVEDLKQAGTRHDSREVLKMSVKTGDSSPAQCLKVAGETPSGPAAFRGLDFRKILSTSCSWIKRVVGEGGGGGVGLGEGVVSNRE